jgi:hypothetical protein
MFKATKRLLAALAVMATACVPSVAYARFDLNPSPPPAASGHTESPILHCIPRGPCISPVGVPAHTADSHFVATTATSPNGGFHWRDAGIGAAGMILLLTAGGSAAIVGRRQHRGEIAT